jgi:hypothetical protein
MMLGNFLMSKTPTFPEIRTRYGQIIIRLFLRLRERSNECRLGREPRQGKRCSACTWRKAKFQIDHAVARLIADNTFAVSAVCPYRVFTENLLLALMMGPEATAALHDQNQRTVGELEIAVKHLRMAIRPYEELKWVTMWMAKKHLSIMLEVIDAEQRIAEAINFFRSRYLNDAEPKSKRGRGKELGRQSIVQGCAEAWEQLTGLRPRKANTKFHDVLAAASVTVFKHRGDVKGWEWQIKRLEERHKKVLRGN